MADLVNSPPVLLVISQHAGPQHVHHFWKLLVHEGGSDYNRRGGHLFSDKIFTCNAQ